MRVRFSDLDRNHLADLDVDTQDAMASKAPNASSAITQVSPTSLSSLSSRTWENDEKVHRPLVF
jgi:hypothetical protein